MSQQQPVGVSGPAKADGRRLGVKQIVVGLLVLYGLLLVVFNRNTVSVNFVLFKTRASLFVVIVLAAALGFLAGYLFDSLRERRRTRKTASA